MPALSLSLSWSNPQYLTVCYILTSTSATHSIRQSVLLPITPSHPASQPSFLPSQPNFPSSIQPTQEDCLPSFSLFLLPSLFLPSFPLSINASQTIIHTYIHSFTMTIQDLLSIFGITKHWNAEVKIVLPSISLPFNKILKKFIHGENLIFYFNGIFSRNICESSHMQW